MGLWTLSPFVGEADENVGVRRVIAVAWFIFSEYAQLVEEEEEKIAARPAMMVGLGAQISNWVSLRTKAIRTMRYFGMTGMVP